MKYKKLAVLAMVAATGALLHEPATVFALSAVPPAVPVAAPPAPRPVPVPVVPVTTYECQVEGNLIVAAPAPTNALVAPARGTATLTGTGLGNLTNVQVLLSVTDSDPSAAPNLPTVETCIYSASAPISLAAPAAPSNLPTLTTSLALDVADSGADCPNPPAGNSFSLALTLFSAGGDNVHFTLTTENDPDANLTLNCAQQDIDGGLPWAVPAPASF